LHNQSHWSPTEVPLSFGYSLNVIDWMIWCRWREIPISLIDPEKGEQTTQACVIAWFQPLPDGPQKRTSTRCIIRRSMDGDRLKNTVIRVSCIAAFVFSGASFCAAKHGNWIEVQTPHFLIVTDAGEEKGRSTATEFERIQAFFRESLASAAKHPSPSVTIFAVKNADAMRKLLPEYFAGGFSSPHQVHPAGVFFHNQDRYFAIVELDTQRSGRFETLYHEYYHALTVPIFPDLPLWLSEGLAEFYGRTQITDEYALVGEADRDLLDLLKQNRLIPLDVLFGVDKKSAYYNEAQKASIFYAESWLLTHYLMIGNPDSHQLLVQYLKALQEGKPARESVGAFGDLKKLQAALSSYALQRKFLSVKAPVAKMQGDTIMIRTLSEPEVKQYFDALASARSAAHDSH
jgi:hypothetical protein